VHLLQWGCVAITALSISACASDWTPETYTTRDGQTFAWPVWTTEGMYLAPPSNRGALFLAPPPLDLARYEAMLIDEIQFRTQDGIPEPRASEREWLEALCRAHLRRMFTRSHWPVVDAPGPGVLRARISVSEIHFPRHDYSLGMSVLNPSGGADFVFELRDSLEHDRVLIFADKRALPLRAYSGVENVGLHRVGSAFLEFTYDLGRRLAVARRGEHPPPLQGRPAARALEEPLDAALR